MNLVSKYSNGFEFSYLEDSNPIIQKIINGKIINSVVDSNKKQELLMWKQKIAKSVYDERNGQIHSPNNHYTVSLSLRFCPSLHGNAKLDVENYIKPILDGISAGLFCEIEQDPTQITRFNYDDSNFDRLYVEKLDDCNPIEEGIMISILQKINF